MPTVLVIIQSITAILLTILVLLQSKGTGLGRSFGSTSYHSRRGVEHLFFRLTIILAIIFVVASAAQLFVH